MKKPLVIELLEKLNQIGVGVVMNINPFIMDNFKNDQDSINHPILAVKAFLLDMEKRNLISLITKTAIFDVIANPNNNIINWLDENIEVEVYLTVAGTDYLSNYYLQQSIFSLNGASERNYKSQKLFSIVTVFISIITAGVVVATYFSTKGLNTNISNLQRQLDTIKKSPMISNQSLSRYNNIKPMLYKQPIKR